MLARYHSADGEFGFAIAESDDAQALARWTNAWNDLLPMDTRPAVNDEGIGRGVAVALRATDGSVGADWRQADSAR